MILHLFPPPQLFVNQIGYERIGPKEGIVSTSTPLTNKSFELREGPKILFRGTLGPAIAVKDWSPNRTYYRADFSKFQKSGRYTLAYGQATSAPFEIGDDELTKRTSQTLVDYFRKQRANTPAELAADSHLLLYGSNQRVDLRGGWCDAGGDVSKYFSHLAYANFMSPQQTPLVVWSLANAKEKLNTPGAEAETLWGADYLMRCLSKDDYFYMIVFSYFNKDPAARRVVGLHANSVTTDEYQAAFREGGGLAIATLARVARWKKDGDYTSAQYLAGAKRAFAHLQKNNLRYDDDGKENIIDDYGALMAATELWISTGDATYHDDARFRAQNLVGRMTPAGWFRADDKTRPFWHASDAGLPVVALARYLEIEKDKAYRKSALEAIRRNLDYNLRVTDAVPNPFGYPRQTISMKGRVQDGFFIPHENETGWWWQGENARLASLATAAIVGGRLVDPGPGPYGVKPALAQFATRQLSWILGRNPYNRCFMLGFGQNNLSPMKSNFGHGSEIGGISNGITGLNPDGSGIEFKTEDNGNEWRWTEQWLPHAAWFLQATTALSKR